MSTVIFLFFSFLFFFFFFFPRLMLVAGNGLFVGYAEVSCRVWLLGPDVSMLGCGLVVSCPGMAWSGLVWPGLARYAALW